MAESLAEAVSRERHGARPQLLDLGRLKLPVAIGVDPLHLCPAFICDEPLVRQPTNLSTGLCGILRQIALSLEIIDNQLFDVAGDGTAICFCRRFEGTLHGRFNAYSQACGSGHICLLMWWRVR